jgi:hypothetical protein
MASEKLSTYKQKRDFQKTQEPSGQLPAGQRTDWFASGIQGIARGQAGGWQDNCDGQRSPEQAITRIGKMTKAEP